MKIIVLDDVVMSVDREHRRSVCALFKEFFPDKQFIITTHDTAWTKELRSQGIVNKKNMLYFLNWNIGTGPIFRLEEDLWEQIENDLKNDYVPAAVVKLRRNAECFLIHVLLVYAVAK